MAPSQSFNDLLRQSVTSPNTTPKSTPTIPPRSTPRTSPKRKISPAITPTAKRTVLRQSPTPLPQRPSPARMQPPMFTGWSGVKVRVFGMPEGWGTWDLYEHLRPYGNLARVEIYERRGGGTREGSVIFRPLPQVTKWLSTGLDIHKNGTRQRVDFKYEQLLDRRAPPALNLTPSNEPSARSHLPGLPELIAMPAVRLDAGVMRSESEMLSLFTAGSPIDLVVNTERKWVDIKFSILTSQLHRDTSHDSRHFKLTSDTSNVRSISADPADGGGRILIIEFEMPPMLYRKATDIRATHDRSVPVWSENQAWFRQTGVDLETDSKEPTELRKADPILDVGRWLTYRLLLDATVVSSRAFVDLGRMVMDNNLRKSTDADSAPAKLFTGEPSELWTWAESSSSSATALDAMLGVHLEFGVRYQLEVCLSVNVLHESNINLEFMAKLAALQPARAMKLLEKIADGKKRVFDVMSIFKLLSQVSVSQKKPPQYCALICGAVITPTTIHYASPVLETSNRVFRKYQKFEDRFLRVKFSDEKYRGRVMNGEDGSQNEVFTRVKRVLQHGIRIADRHYEFLAFGNSQFRENGAYFFAPIGDINTKYIRDGMGTFTQLRDVDRNIAKYASRLGQAFTTTRGMSIKVHIQKIADVKRNNDTFTDGVGKISPFLAQTISYELNLPDPTNDYPSVFQFRIGGCKGVLAVDPALKGGAIVCMRPSQEKFLAEYYGLEVCRWSQFTAANLNVQIILVLNARGVDTEVFIRKMKEALSDIEQAMTSEPKAEQQLCRKTDINGMTLVLVDMIKDGFMSTQDPFFMTCLRLWRSWMNKYLKEKARIPVDQGAFVFGCIDETATLRGHFDSDVNTDPRLRETTVLPEIFLQIKDPSTGQYRVVQEVCSLARNPSLHPGDVRVVRAVDMPALHHLKDCVVLPQTGDRGLASMCSGGDLDGDDYLVMWDKDLLPKEWYHEPMNYEPPAALKSDGPVTVDNITSFFVTHMKNDNVGRIAMAHRFWADSNACPQGVKDDRCIELARLHSMAVDYAKSGVPATFPKSLRVKEWPHWAEKQGKKTYKSRKVLGRLYDEVQRVPFLPAWEEPFDARILGAFELTEEMLSDAREVKTLYDEAVRRIMAQHSIQSEFEIWTTFILGHSQDENDYKLAERLGETVATLKQRHQELCYEKAGTTPQERDWIKLAPFVAAMYTVTAEEVSAAAAANKEIQLVAGQHVPARENSFANMPFMSFPWIFHRELGHIARRRSPGYGAGGFHGGAGLVRSAAKKQQQKQKDLEEADPLPALPEVTIDGGVINEGDLLDIHFQEPVATPGKLDQNVLASTTADTNLFETNIALNTPEPATKAPAQSNDSETTTYSPSENNAIPPSRLENEPPLSTSGGLDDPGRWSKAMAMSEAEGEEEDAEPGEVVLLELDNEPSALDALTRLGGHQ
ncbi:hypothetical protein LTS10_008167 [Elasticomyces elasticus]|nr:hypothetical protein LTS10_008167 [Elasticomyces elasticus]